MIEPTEAIMSSDVRERPILMSEPMVAALHEGRKTQTRRIVKWENHAGVNLAFSGLSADHIANTTWGLYSRDGDARWQERAKAVCPYGKPGDQMWVKETFAPWHSTCVECPNEWDSLVTREDRGGLTLNEWVEWNGRPQIAYRADGNGEGWMPSIFMPRWASRITLEITEVRVERLQDISEEDAKAEGALGGCVNCGETPCHPGCVKHAPDFRDGYASIWESIHGTRSWYANPWVWAISFRQVGGNHDGK